MGNSGQCSFQVLKRECPIHDIKPGTKTGNLRNALAMEMESTNWLASEDFNYHLRSQPEGHCTSSCYVSC